MSLAPSRGGALPTRLNDLALLATLAGLAGILSTAMVLQYAGGEVPCPLCLLQRVAMFGIAFGLMAHFRHGYSARNIGMSLLWTLLLLIISVRQTLLDICPRPGHAYIGDAVFGLHMAVWSVLIALAILAAFAGELLVFGSERLYEAPPSPLTTRLGGLLSLFVITLCLINLVSAIVQCGLGACHTSGYKLL